MTAQPERRGNVWALLAFLAILFALMRTPPAVTVDPARAALPVPVSLPDVSVGCGE